MSPPKSKAPAKKPLSKRGAVGADANLVAPAKKPLSKRGADANVVAPAEKPLSKRGAIGVDANLVAATLTQMSRLLNRLSERISLKNAQIGIAEWTLLHEIARFPVARAGQMSRRLEVTPQRVVTMVKSLKEAGYLDVKQSEQDPRARDITLSAEGRRHVNEIDEELHALFAGALKNKPQMLAALRGWTKRIVDHVVESEKSEVSPPR